ncbi:hypothetical protein D5039_00075 [Verminephrobacter aporrectodeae subsp. tuberculatae]|uniref:Uncharacterized protein n=1 Tax=Verminephrobacter aporrectodeae subsp. tuberculatae TaxID=1110392 RepID=A0ABT3KMT0_9BURK|nr:hypothetical protein [Verminephrobacter aporrectodeae]MCW5319631.1 hypothetical protein [Verminephrobacter aporrectodeae subsp. tuberculatae]
MLDNLGQLHNAIVAGLRAKIEGAPTIDAYPVIERRIVLPAVLIELAQMEPGADPGTGETALIGSFQARAIVDPNARNADLAVRELAARIAVAITHETWGLDVGVAQLVQIGEDAFKPELDSYLVWLVEWTHQFHLGRTAWPYPDDTGKTLVIGMYPATGFGHEDDYMVPGEELPAHWGEQ